MLKHDEQRFLDDVTVAEVSQALGIDIFCVTGVEELMQTCLQPISPASPPSPN